MTRTANATYAMKIAAMIRIAAETGHPFLCAICGKPILPGQRLNFDHGHAVGRDGPNTAENLFLVHDERSGEFDCHTRKTAHPRGPHTAIGGDTFEAAKTKRLVASTNEHRAVLTGEAVRPPSGLRGRKAIQGRLKPWPPRGSRPMNKVRRA